jgi:hypothetical protein
VVGVLSFRLLEFLIFNFKFFFFNNKEPGLTGRSG